MITSWNLICDKCCMAFSTAFPEQDRCPKCGKLAIESMNLRRKWKVVKDNTVYQENL